MKASDFIVILGSFFIITTSTVYGQEAKDSDLAKRALICGITRRGKEATVLLCAIWEGFKKVISSTFHGRKNQIRRRQYEHKNR